MEDQILDAPETKRKNKFSKRAFWLFVITTLMYGSVGYSFRFLFLENGMKSENNWLFNFLSLLSVVALILPIFGLSFSIKGFKRNEKGVVIWIAFLGNLIFCLLLALILFANALDILRSLN